MTVDSIMTNVSSVINTVVDIISNNSVLSTLLGMGVVSVGALTFKKLLK